jgi:hypothetical protein
VRDKGATGHSLSLCSYTRSNPYYWEVDKRGTKRKERIQGAPDLLPHPGLGQSQTTAQAPNEHQPCIFDGACTGDAHSMVWPSTA